MIAMQQTLDFAGASASVDETMRAALRYALRGEGWRSAANLAEALTASDRDIRRIAAECDDIISFPGSPGYKLLTNCTVEEFRRFRDANRSQARKMIARTIRAERLFHAKGAA